MPQHIARPAGRPRLTVLLLALVFLSWATPRAWSQHTPSSEPSGALPAKASPASPLPVTVITQQMIVDIGARNLKDALLAYVPGLTFVQDHNEVVVAMRGVYASSQQKILILVNGHVLNSRSYAAANPDFSIALDNVARIEVVRGPASSLYGNGALTAVVNIYTRSGEELGGTALRAGVGTFGQTRLGALFGGKTGQAIDVLAWGSFYQSDGQSVDVPSAPEYTRTPGNPTAILDGFLGPASHDVGVNLKAKAFTLFAAHRYGKYTEPFSGGGPTGQSYTYRDYQAGEGVGPGMGIGAFNLDVSYDHALNGGETVRLQGYFDRRDISVHIVTDPTVQAHQLARWNEWDAGVLGQVSGSYETSLGPGRWLAGAQFDRMRVDDSVLVAGTGGAWMTTGASGGVLDLGREDLYSGFLEVTQVLAPRWTATGALRYDLKVRHEGDNIGELSPRAGVTFVPDDMWNLAASYAESFADAPYWYRYNSFPSYRGGRNLKPEYLRSWQFTPSAKLPANVTARLNLFYNNLQNAVWRNKNAGPTEPIYQNGGFLTTWGVEQEIGYAREAFNLTGILTWQRVVNAQNYDVAGTRIQNVPSWTWNAVLNVNPWAAAKKDVWFNLTARYIGQQASPINITIGSTTFKEPDRLVERALVVNAGVRVGHLWAGRAFLDARLYNLLDTQYEQGGSVAHPYPQAGRSVMVTAGVGW